MEVEWVSGTASSSGSVGEAGRVEPLTMSSGDVTKGCMAARRI